MITLFMSLKDSGEMLTGDGAICMAKHILDPNYGNLESDSNSDLAKSLEAKNMRVLVCHKFKKKMSIEEGSLVFIRVSLIFIHSMMHVPVQLFLSNT